MARPYGKKSYRGNGRHRPAADPSVEIQHFVVELFDRGDGSGVDWRVACEAVFKAGFSMLDRLAAQHKRGLAQRVCISAYTRLNEDGAGDIGGMEIRLPDRPADGQGFDPGPEQGSRPG